MADTITQVNNQIVAAISGIQFRNAIGWIIFAIILIGCGVFAWFWYTNKKTFSKKITILEIVGINYVPTMTDKAKVVKIGSGGFEILYLQKLKIYRIAYGGRVGKDTYYFFVGKDGYWYNGMLSADMYAIDQHKGLIPIVTTNPSMRSQYTSLEKQIDTLHADKKGFMDKYGAWVFSIGFVIIVGVFAWLIFREMSPIMSSIAEIAKRQADLTTRIDVILSHLNLNSTSSGLVPA